MNEFEFAPAPWSADEATDGVRAIRDADGFQIAEVICERGHATTRLVENAPLLFNAALALEDAAADYRKAHDCDGDGSTQAGRAWDILKRRGLELRATVARIIGDEPTYWNYEPTPARKVRVVIGPAPRATWWCAKLEGQEREAVEVKYPGSDPFYLDNEDGRGWLKVTVGRGGPDWGHSELPVERVIESPTP